MPIEFSALGKRRNEPGVVGRGKTKSCDYGKQVYCCIVIEVPAKQV
jgi:hypothetical protein